MSEHTELRFDGRVAIVTGAGRGIGRAYARLLAARGARVVVNDLGGSIEGDGADAGPAADVVEEISRDGGEAIADSCDVATTDGADALVASTLDAFGRVDVVVNNAGIMRWATFPDVSDDDVAAHLDVHVRGSFNVTRAAWPGMAERGYGRVVMTTSAGVFGLANNTSYATAKGAVIGLTRSLAVAGADCGITVNAIAPGAMTRMAGPNPSDSPAMSPDLVAPMVAYLAHETCTTTGEVYAAGFGRFARVFIAMTEGFVDPSGAPTPEAVAANWDTVNDASSYTVPKDLPDWSRTFLRHLH